MNKKVEVKVSLKGRTQQALYATKEWCSENKETLLALAPTLIAGSIELIKMVVRTGYVKEERRLKDNYIYDREHGHYYELCRKPTNKEWLMIDERKKTAYQNLGTILMDMKLLK